MKNLSSADFMGCCGKSRGRCPQSSHPCRTQSDLPLCQGGCRCSFSHREGQTQVHCRPEGRA